MQMPKKKWTANPPLEQRAAPVPTASEVKRAIVRLALGQIQMIGAVVGLYLLLSVGVSALSVGVVAATTLATIISKILFRKK